MKTIILGIRVSPKTRDLLQAAAGTPAARGRDGRGSTLAREYVMAGLRRDGYLPEEDKTHAKSQAA